MYFQVAFSIAFDPQGPGYGMPVRETVASFIDNVKEVVESLERFV